MLRGFLLFHGHPFTLLVQVSSLTQSSRITLLYYFFTFSSAQQRKVINSLSVCVLIYEILVAKRLGNCQSEEYLSAPMIVIRVILPDFAIGCFAMEM